MTQTKIINTLIKGLPLAALSATVLAAHPSDAAIIRSNVEGGYVNQPGASQFGALAVFRGLKPLKYRCFWE
ncbi:hypothetical protein MC7420_5147 [Coleofasciculus chthonoplastes PCC 7420]|uniref:Uncharacterized protein n=1 Tax=Coleofasciculus chthonoplastes PCC 7420 TaxID=118168 RepID=B4W1M0_9CYAN|nr:hypothetical protein MC7420_5147 [Coleofasciculus chthonoplastes PCC 7420]